jgi:hypothetical protein
VDHEPALALFAEDQGLSIIRRLAQAKSKLKPGGWMVLEMGHEQGEAVASIFREAGWASVEVRKDLGGRCLGNLYYIPISGIRSWLHQDIGLSVRSSCKKNVHVRLVSGNIQNGNARNRDWRAWN